MADGDGATSGGATMVDAQFTIVKYLKPAPDFESVYQGVDARTPIAIPCVKDARAGTPGFSPDLMEGVAVPQGARLCFWIPMCFIPDPESLSPFRFYSYRFAWRFNNLAGFRAPAANEPRKPYHLAVQSPGASDTTFPVAAPRVTIPASWGDILVEGTEPATGSFNSNLRIEQITPRIDSLADLIQPLLPDGRPGVIQQGVFDPATSGGAAMPISLPFWRDAEGDELIILVRRTEPTGVWDFTDPALDLAFSNVYGTGDGAHPIFRDVGITIQSGTNP